MSFLPLTESITSSLKMSRIQPGLFMTFGQTLKLKNIRVGDQTVKSQVLLGWDIRNVPPAEPADFRLRKNALSAERTLPFFSFRRRRGGIDDHRSLPGLVFQCRALHLLPKFQWLGDHGEGLLCRAGSRDLNRSIIKHAPPQTLFDADIF